MQLGVGCWCVRRSHQYNGSNSAIQLKSYISTCPQPVEGGYVIAPPPSPILDIFHSWVRTWSHLLETEEKANSSNQLVVRGTSAKCLLSPVTTLLADSGYFWGGEGRVGSMGPLAHVGPTSAPVGRESVVQVYRVMALGRSKRRRVQGAAEVDTL